MKYYTLFLFVFFSLYNLEAQIIEAPAVKSETSTYYLIRHAEKNQSDKTNKNPNLIEKGLLRAAQWTYVLEHVTLDAIYSTDYNRTKQTAAPLAEKLNLNQIIGLSMLAFRAPNPRRMGCEMH